MALEMGPNESVRKAVRRIVRKQLDRILEALERPGDHDEAVHEIRQRFKKVRAVLRLLRDELGEKTYRQQNACFRDAAQPLAELRDAMVLLKALDSVTERAAGKTSASRLAEVRKVLQADLDAARQKVLEDKEIFARVRQTVEEARRRLKKWTISHRGWSAMRPGLRRVYKSCRFAYAAACADATMENLHEWRKQAKYFWHQLQLLQPIFPREMQDLTEQTHKLTQLLGDDHDLAVLRVKVTADSARLRGDNSLEGMLAALDSRRRELQEEAFSMADQVHGEKPKAFMCRLKDYWKTWRKQTKATPAQPCDEDAGQG